MIIGFVGTPGSGKTYDAVKKILENLRRGRVVCTNIDGMDDPICQRLIKDRLNIPDDEFDKQFIFLSRDDVESFWIPRKVNAGTEMEYETLIAPAGSLIVLDEVHKNFSNRDWSSDKNKGFAEWASTHRHQGYDVMLITQDIEKVDKHVRSLLEWTYFYRKVNFLGSLVTQKYIRYSYVGDDHHGKPVATNTYTYDKEVFRCYKSYVTKDAKEVGFMTHVNVLKHPLFFALPIVFGYAIYSFSQSSFVSGDLFGQKKALAAKTAPKKVNPPLPSPAPSAGVTVSAPVMAPMSSTTRLPLTFPPVQQNEWSLVRIDGYVKSGKQTVISVNDRMYKIPHKDIRSLDFVGLTCEMRGMVSQHKGGMGASAPAVAPMPPLLPGQV